MATHGFIKIERESSSSTIQAIHDGYLNNLLSDLFHVPYFTYSLLKEKGNRNSYRYSMFEGYNNDSRFNNFEDILSMWHSIIPLHDFSYTYENMLIAFDPLMYLKKNNEVTDYDVIVKFDDKRLPSCIIEIVKYYDLTDGAFDIFMDKLNDLIYFDENKVKKLPNGSYHMNPDKIVCDLVYQDISHQIKRAKKIDDIIS